MRTTTVRRIATACLAAFMMNAEVVWADCYSEQQRIIDYLQRVSSQMSSDTSGHCSIARSIKRDFPQVLAFYERCSIVDPDGSMRTYVKQLLQWAADTEKAACGS